MLNWNQTDLTEFFGAIPTFDEDAMSHSFELTRDNLRLLITIFDAEYAVYTSLFYEKFPQPLITIKTEFCTHAHITTSHSGAPCFEAGATRHSVTDMGIPPFLTRGLRIFIEPQFQIELIDSHD